MLAHNDLFFSLNRHEPTRSHDNNTAANHSCNNVATTHRSAPAATASHTNATDHANYHGLSRRSVRHTDSDSDRVYHATASATTTNATGSVSTSASGYTTTGLRTNPSHAPDSATRVHDGATTGSPAASRFTTAARCHADADHTSDDSATRLHYAAAGYSASAAAADTAE